MSTHSQDPIELFLKDVSQHVLTVEQDNGVHRCLRFGKPGSSCMHFRLTTFPGHLCYTGDVGSFVFSRLPDMFEFFRQEKLGFNSCYWSEKLIATDRNGGHVEYDHAKMLEVVNSLLDDWDWADEETETEARSEVGDVLGEIEGYTGPDIPVSKIMECTPEGAEDIFSEIWEYGFTRPTIRMTWCMLAIVWGIQQYDAHKAQLAAA